MDTVYPFSGRLLRYTVAYLCAYLGGLGVRHSNRWLLRINGGEELRGQFEAAVMPEPQKM